MKLRQRPKEKRKDLWICAFKEKKRWVKKEEKRKKVNSEVFNPEVATLRKEYSEA
jgi:hypothetical protein